MASRIPTSPTVTESAVIEATFSTVWHLIKLPHFADFWSALSKSETVNDVSSDTDIAKWTFKDGQVVEVKLEEHSTIDHFITYSIITATPQLTYSSVYSTVRVYPITSGKNEGHTFVTWSGSFSNDADAGVIADATYKRREALADLAKAAVAAKK